MPRRAVSQRAKTPKKTRRALSFRVVKKSNSQTLFQCELEKSQCQYQTKKGRCKRTFKIGTEYCFQHLKIVYGVKVHNSRLIQGEKGLFAVRNFKKGDFIIPYIGEIISAEELKRRYDFDGYENVGPYALKAGNKIIDAACRRGSASMINDARGTGVSPNCDLTEKGIYAIADIEDGDELLTDYGETYWEESAISWSTKRAKYKTQRRSKK